MPTVPFAHPIIDVPSFLVVTAFLSASGGLLLLLVWLQHRATTALALWGTGYLFGAIAATLLGSPGLAPDLLTIGLANAFACGAYGMMWAGARSFEGRHVSVPLVAAGAAIWIAAFQFQGFAQNAPARVALVSAVMAAYALLGVRELWHARDRELVSRWPTMLVVSAHAGFLLVRVPMAAMLALSAASGQPQGMMVTAMVFQALFTTFCLPLLRVAMTKERAELEQRKAALTDSLTGVANRRAFFDRGVVLLEQTLADRRSAALLLFDLDRFKTVNDTAGHEAGDGVLKAFCGLVVAAIGRGDVFGRLGGEEFACLLADVSMAEALQTAERLRGEFAALRFAGLEVRPTVSVGVAVTGDAGRSLSALLATADRALYRAKADGRNRVASAPPVLVEKAALRRIDAAALAAPVAG